MRTKLQDLPPAMQAEAATLLPGLAPTLDERLVSARKTAARTNAKNDGRDFQKDMETTAAAYHARGVAMLRKADPPVRVFWKTEPSGERRQVVIFRPNPWTDYVGTWTMRGGRMLMIEAKSSSAHRLPFRRDHGHLSLAQFNSMFAWYLSGAVLALVWQFNGACRLWTMPMLLAAEAAGAKSLLFDTGLPIPRGEGTLLWDFLAVLERETFPENKC